MITSLNNFKRDYLNYLEKIRGYSDLTIKSYDETLVEAFALSEIRLEDKKLYLNLMPLRLHIASQSAKTIAKKLSAIRSFCNYLRDEGFEVDLQADESIKVPKSLPKPIPHEHIMQAIETASLEERLVVVMLYTLGLRISELSSLELKNITNSWVRVMGKGSKEREIPLIETTTQLIAQYKEMKQPKRFLFEKKSEKLSENSLRYIITKVFKNVGIKVTPHQLRHSYATGLLNNSARIADVSELLGHASMATTQIYTKLGSTLKMENYLHAHPLCKDND